MEGNHLSNVITTLIFNGFHINKVSRYSGSDAIVHVNKFDRLGAKIAYDILITSDTVPSALIQTLISQAHRDNSTPILISDHFDSGECISYDNEKFFSFFGGIVNTGLVLIPNLTEILDQLGHNILPNDLTGEPDDLHELYVSECLQYLLESPTRRYGMDRAFQSLPDGIVLAKQRFMIPFDAKSYTKGFGIGADDVKRFASYIEDFRSRYSDFFGDAFTFLVISGHFTDSQSSLQNRAAELYKQCNCRLSTITSKNLAAISQRLSQVPDIKRSIIWKNVLSEIVIDESHIEKEIKRIGKDKLH